MMKQVNVYDFLCEFFQNHINEIKTALYSSFIFLNIDTDVVKILIYLMFIDTLSGIIKAFALEKGFHFKILFFGLCSKLLVLLIPMVLALVGKGISKSYDFIPVLDAVLKILVVSEGLSIITNFYVVKTKKEVENFDVITMLLSFLRRAMMSIVKNSINKMEP